MATLIAASVVRTADFGAPAPDVAQVEAQCDHNQCTRTAEPDMVCGRDREHCCGCCWSDAWDYERDL